VKTEQGVHKCLNYSLPNDEDGQQAEAVGREIGIPLAVFSSRRRSTEVVF